MAAKLGNPLNLAASEPNTVGALWQYDWKPAEGQYTLISRATNMAKADAAAH